ncbi:MAG: hypothetical protein ACK5PP_05270, partial [Acidimicrobiales bacterium]
MVDEAAGTDMVAGDAGTGPGGPGIRIEVAYERSAEMRGTGPVKIGWILNNDKAGVIFSPPERVRSVEMSKR